MEVQSLSEVVTLQPCIDLPDIFYKIETLFKLTGGSKIYKRGVRQLLKSQCFISFWMVKSKNKITKIFQYLLSNISEFG